MRSIVAYSVLYHKMYVLKKCMSMFVTLFAAGYPHAPKFLRSWISVTVLQQRAMSSMRDVAGSCENFSKYTNRIYGSAFHDLTRRGTRDPRSFLAKLHRQSQSHFIKGSGSSGNRQAVQASRDRISK